MDLIANGFQIAFLAFAAQFLAMLLVKVFIWKFPGANAELELVTQTSACLVAIVILFGIAPVRRICMTLLRAPIPSGASSEFAFVLGMKATIPLAVIGGYAALSLLFGNPAWIVDWYPRYDIEEQWQRSFAPLEILRLVAISWIVGPVLEEIVFRGLMYRAFERQYGWIVATLLSSLAFGLSHFGRILTTFLGAILLTCVMRRMGSLRASMVVHGTYNCLVSWPILGAGILRMPDGTVTDVSTWWLHLVCLAFVAVALPIYLRLSRHDRTPVSAKP